MRKLYKPKLLIIFSVWLAVFIGGCVDTNVNPIPSSIDFSSQMKIVNLVSVPDTATVTYTFNGQSLDLGNFGSETPGTGLAFLTIPSGSKTLIVRYIHATAGTTIAADTLKFAAATEYKFRAYLVGTNNSSELFVNYQRYIWQTPGSENGKTLFPNDTTGYIEFFNGSPDAVLNSVTINGEETEFDTPLEMGDGVAYIKLAAGVNYAFDVLYDTDQHVTFDYTVEAQHRYTAVIYDVAVSIKNAVFIDD